MKLKFFLVVLLLTTVFCVSGEVSAMTEAEKQALIIQIQTQIAQLLEQIRIIQSQQSASAWCHSFNANLGFANSGSIEIGDLHIVLQKEDISYGSDTQNEYGEDTAGAVVQFQAKYGIKQTGYVGPLTRAKINSIYGCNATTVTNPTCTPNWNCLGWSTCANGQQTRSCYDANYCGNTANAPSQTQACTTACTPSWNCTAWSTCANGQQTRSCYDPNYCNVTSSKPLESQSCTVACTPNWQTGTWSTCANAIQTRTVTDANNCGVTTNKPVTNQACTATCTPNWQTGTWSTCANAIQTRTVTDANNCGITTGKPATTQSCTVACTPNWQCASWSNCINSQQVRNCYDLNYCGTTVGAPSLTQSCTVACTPNWQTGTWSTCANAIQTRTVTDANNCGITTGKPATTQSCTVACTPNWQTGTWSTCANAIQTRTVTDANNCGITTGKPATSQACTATCTPSCSGKTCGSDGCGGVCGTCSTNQICDASQNCVAKPLVNVALGKLRPANSLIASIPEVYFMQNRGASVQAEYLPSVNITDGSYSTWGTPVPLDYSFHNQIDTWPWYYSAESFIDLGQNYKIHKLKVACNGSQVNLPWGEPFPAGFVELFTSVQNQVVAAPFNCQNETPVEIIPSITDADVRLIRVTVVSGQSTPILREVEAWGYASQP